MRKEGYSRNEWIVAVLAVTFFALLPSFSNVFFWMNLVFPLPVALVVFRFGSREGGLLAFTGFVLASILAAWVGLLPAMFVPGMHMLAGIILGVAASKEVPPWKTCLATLIMLGIGWGMLGTLYAGMEQRNLYTDMQSALESGIDAASGVILTDDRIPAGEREAMRTTFARTRELIPELLPGGLAASLTCMAWVNLVLCHACLKKWRGGGSPWGDSARWRMPDQAVWLVIGAGIILLLPDTLVRFWSKNIAIVLAFLYFFQGVAVLAGMLKKWSLPPILRILIYLFAILQVHFLFILAILGLADIWADFNKIRVSNNIQA